MSRTRPRASLFPPAWVVALAAAGVVWMVWFFLVRHTLVQGDDFTSAALSGTPGARFTVAAWWHQAVHDWWSATGRQSATVFRVFQRLGVPTLHVVLPLVEAALALVLGGWMLGGTAARTRVPRPARVGLALLACCAVPVVGWFAPPVNGDALFWMLASFDYVFSPMLALAAGLVLTRLLDADAPLPSRAWLALLVLAPLMHETSSLALLAVCLGVLLLLRGRPGRRRLPFLAAAVLGCALQLCAPGLWARLGEFTGRLAETGMALRLHQGANAMTTLFLLGHVELVALAVSLLLATWVARCTILARLFAAAACLAGLLGWWLATRFHALGAGSYGHRLTGIERHWALGVTLAGLLDLACLLCGVWCARDRLGTRPLLAVLGMGGAFSPTLASGVTTPRAYLPMLLWSLAATGCLWAALAARPHSARLGSLGAAVLGVAALLVAGCWVVRSHTALVANERVHAEVLRQVQQAAQGRATTVVFPRRYPAPDYLYGNAFLLSRYAAGIRTYYGLPATTRLVGRP